MKIFLDTAEADVIRQYFKTGLIDGMTTNPTLIRKSGRNHEEAYQEFKDIGLTDISMEVIGNTENMISEGRRLAKKFGKVATIKVPCTPDGLAACKSLADDSIKVNVTLIFSVAQAVLAAKAGAKYVSPFVGRLDDVGQDGIELVAEIVDIYLNYGIQTEVLAASIRHPLHCVQAANAGADIATVPYKVLVDMAKHPLTDQGVERFLKDWGNSSSN